MRREQLEHAIRAARQIIEREEAIVVGSQAILGTFTEAHLPEEATMSFEVDVLPIGDTDKEICRLADMIEGVAGDLSLFDENHGFHIDGDDLGTGTRRTSGGSSECFQNSRQMNPARAPLE